MNSIWKISTLQLGLLIMIGIVEIVNIITPFTGDVLVSFGAAKQAEYLGDFPNNVYQSWNLRGIGYKFLIYGFEKLIDFLSIQNIRLFQIVVKSIYYVIFFGFSVLCIKQISTRLKMLKISLFHVNVSIFIGILASSQWMHMQAEEVAVFLTIYFICFSLSESKFLNYISGLFIPLLLSLKVITIGFIIFPFFILLYFREVDLLKRFIISSLVFSLMTIWIYVFIIPLEIQDTKDAMMLQSSITINLHSIKSFIRGLIRSFSHLSVIIPGFIAMSIIIYQMIRKRKKLDLLIISTIFSLSIFPIFLQSKFFAYHYLVVIPMFIIFIISVGRINSKIWYGLMVFTLMIWIITCVSGINIPFVDKYANFGYYKKNYYDYKYKICSEMIEKYDINKSDEVLFLSSGSINYFLDVKSYSRYYFPLPLQRIKYNDGLKEKTIYNDTYERILKYQGKFIILQPNWFNLDLLSKLKNKIDREYNLIDKKENPNPILKGGKILLYLRKG